MKLLIDEDSESKLLVRLLRGAGHDVLTVTEAGLSAHSDSDVMATSRQLIRVVLTRNIRDFLRLHENDSDHPGILAEYQDSNPSKNMSAVNIVQAIANLEESDLNVEQEFIALNHWASSPKHS